MILTSKEVLFVKEASGAVVDRLPLSTITFVGRVNLAQTARRHSVSSATNTSAKGKRAMLGNAGSSAGSLIGTAARGNPPAPDEDGADSDGAGMTSSGGRCFEIRTAAAGSGAAEAGGRQRSYIARAAAAAERDAWVDAVGEAVRAAEEAARARTSLLTWAQVGAPPFPPPSPPPAPFN
jgi:hypothetical protein